MSIASVSAHTSGIWTKVEFLIQPRRAPGASWLITMLDNDANYCVQRGAVRFPQAHAVVDDFGTLTIVGRWQ